MPKTPREPQPTRAPLIPRARHSRVGAGLLCLTLSAGLAACSSDAPGSASGSGGAPAPAGNGSAASGPATPATQGRWDLLNLPNGLKINAIHSALLPTGEVLLIAGSGNEKAQFDAGTFVSLIYNPATGKAQMIDTPVDMFCAGHAHLPNGHLLVAGGTKAYEVAPSQLTRAGAVLTMVNETPDKPFVLPKGTKVVGEKSGRQFVTDDDIIIPKAELDPKTGKVTASKRNVYISATVDGKAGVVGEDAYHVVGMTGDDAKNLHGYAQALNFEKKNYQGIDSAYEFDPFKRAYVKVDPMHYARWYPTLTQTAEGHILTVSGLDAAGKILDGQIETYDPKTHKWTERPDLFRLFPTYPSIFQTAKPDVLFSAAVNGGWGPADQGREPGFWKLTDNTFTPVPGLRDPDKIETGAAGWLGPVNDQRIVVLGGGAIGDAPQSTGRIDVIDLSAAAPKFEPYAALPQPTRYPNIVTLPTGDLFITNGSKGYRGRGKSDIFKSYLLGQRDGKLTELASPSVGRNYHASALLLPNGQILVAGSDPLFSDAADSVPGTFEQRIEIFTPPYLLDEQGGKVARPTITKAPESAMPGDSIQVSVKGATAASTIAKVRLLRPGAVTHVTDTNQRVVELAITPTEGGVTATVPKEATIVPAGHYMLIAIDDKGVPSEAKWISVGQAPVAGGHAGH